MIKKKNKNLQGLVCPLICVIFFLRVFEREREKLREYGWPKFIYFFKRGRILSGNLRSLDKNCIVAAA